MPLARSTALTVVSAVLPPAERRVVASHVLGLRAGHPTVPVTVRGADTDLAAALAVASADAALVVLGRALDPAAPSAGTAIAVAGRSACPVLVVPSDGSARLPDRGAARRSAVALSWSADPDDPGHRAAPRRQGRRR